MYEQTAFLGCGPTPADLWARWLRDPRTLARFTAKICHRSPTACWYWTGAIGADGHGRFRAGSRTNSTSHVITAHVYAHQLAHGLCTRRLLETDLVIRHRCDETSCQNPAHLQIGTVADNTADYHTRRWRHRGPLADIRGAAGRARAIRTAILANPDPHTLEAAIATACAAGYDDDQQLALMI